MEEHIKKQKQLEESALSEKNAKLLSESKLLAL